MTRLFGGQFLLLFSKSSLVVDRHDFHETRKFVFPVLQDAGSNGRARIFVVLGDQFLDFRRIMRGFNFFQGYHLQIAVRQQTIVRVIDIGNPPGHPCGPRMIARPPVMYSSP